MAVVYLVVNGVLDSLYLVVNGVLDSRNVTLMPMLLVVCLLKVEVRVRVRVVCLLKVEEETLNTVC